MTDKPIIFSAPMVRALLDCRKTQTRRDMKIKRHKGFFQFGQSETSGFDWTFRRADHVWEDYKHDELLTLLPHQVGDRLWVRENWRPHGWFSDCTEVLYMANKCDGYTAMSRQIPYGPDGKEARKFIEANGKWRPSIHMPRWASRITLKVTDVRIERLQDITNSDAVDEGIQWLHEPNGFRDYLSDDPDARVAMRTSFQSLWASINGPDAWESNPWVTAYTFTIHNQNIDQKGA